MCNKSLTKFIVLCLLSVYQDQGRGILTYLITNQLNKYLVILRKFLYFSLKMLNLRISRAKNYDLGGIMGFIRVVNCVFGNVLPKTIADLLICGLIG